MNIAVYQPYGEIYDNDKLFDVKSCQIGQNLLLPGIKLKEKLETLGHNYHTIDYYNFNDIDVILFFEVPIDSIFTINSITDFIRYLVKLKFKNDYLLKSKHKNIKKVLVIQEPPVIRPISYIKNYHSLFSKIMTWNDDIVDNKKYYKFYYPQVKPQDNYNSSFNEKKFLTMICGNKSANYLGELYSKRREIIEHCEKNKIDFDLYGIGWDNRINKSYRGKTTNKIETLSNYKYSICFENMTNINGYITEKIFDCFFSHCIPVYYGANNIKDFIPDKCFIDFRNFTNIDQLLKFLNDIDEKTYNEYLSNIDKYINSNLYYNKFSIDAYVNNMIDFILNNNSIVNDKKL